MTSFTILSEIGLAAGSAYGILVSGRNLAVAYVIKEAKKEITARGEKLSREIDCLFVKPADQKDGPIQTLLQFGQDVSSQRLTAKQEVLKLKQELPSASKTVTAADVRRILDQITVLFTTAYSGTVQRKLQKSVKHAIKHALVEKSQHMAAGQVIETAGDGMHYTVPDFAHDLIQRGLHHIPHKWVEISNKPFDAVEQPVVDVLDQMGATEILVDTAAIALGALPDIAINAIDAATDFMAVPGLISGVKAVWREVSMLDSGEIDFGDAFVNGLVPAGIKTGAVAIGVAIDASCGFMTFGLFTAISYFAGSGLKNAIHKDEINSGLRQLEPHLRAINLRKTQAVKNIGESIKINFGEFLDHIDKLPDFFDRPDVKAAVDTLAVLFAQDFQLITVAIQHLHRGVVFKTPANSFLDWVLWINRRDIALGLYQKIVNAHICELEEATINISRFSFDGKIEAAFHAILSRPQYRRGRVLEQIGEIISTAPLVLAEHYSDLETWKNRGKVLSEKATAAVSITSTSENKAVRELEDRLSPSMAEARTRIRANMRRLGIDPKNCP